MDEIISYKMCAVKVRNAKLRNYLNFTFLIGRMTEVRAPDIYIYIYIAHWFVHDVMASMLKDIGKSDVFKQFRSGVVRTSC
jgi:hypothetical protein